MMLKFNTARAAAASPEDILRQAFADRIDAAGQLSAVFTDSQCIGAVGVAGLPLRLPAIQGCLSSRRWQRCCRRRLAHRRCSP